MARALCVLLSFVVATMARPSEVWTHAQEEAAGVRRRLVLTPPPRDFINAGDLPASFSWADHNGQSLGSPKA